MNLTTLHSNLPGGPRPFFAKLPAEILNLIVEQLYLGAKGPRDEPDIEIDDPSVWRTRQKSISKAIGSLAALARTCRRLNKVVVPFLYKEAFLLQANQPPQQGGRRGLALYDLLMVLAQEHNGLADLVQVYEEPWTIADNLRAFTGRCDIETKPGLMTKQEAESYHAMFPMFNRYIPFLAKMVANEDLLDHPDLLTDIIPAVIICHCRKMKRLEHLTIGDRGSGLGRFLWRDVITRSVTFPKLEEATLRGKIYSNLPATALQHLCAPLAEAVFFVDRAPNLRRLTLDSFSSEPRSTISLLPQQHLSSLELHQCAFLNKADLVNIIEACPKLERFVFTSEASPTVRRVKQLGFDFLGPQAMLEALAPVSQHLKELSIEYTPLIDSLFKNGPNDASTNGAMNAHDNLGGYENLIKTLGDIGFPNLRNLRICHSALWRTPLDGPETNQLVELVKGCPRLESLDVTQIKIRDAQIRLQLEELAKAMGSVDTVPLLKGIRIAISWPASINHRPLLSDLLTEEHLATYRKRGIKFLVDVICLWSEMSVLNAFSPVHESVDKTVTIHPMLQTYDPSRKLLSA
ncbi:hypothetical protein B0T20DRAFT_392192 [Sordaria brevicollis]|uniref:F-box domain-containing protein n=1 Tax=Sordaria brevicollis TaxID=83679 RepID=A0AAE0PFX7_SORBR|nr:hypothetical protein B0T20DRAFT_392192 [Sordaria brevicollis]